MDSIRLLAFDLELIPHVLIALAVAFTLHEFAHAYFAYRFGDRTAYNQGRVSLNPMRHLDVIGTLLILIAGFGWAKPVPVNRHMFKHPRLMGIVTTAAGPLSNLLLAFLFLFVYYWMTDARAFDAMPYEVYRAVHTFLQVAVYLNLLLFVFNLLPLPPLDGYRIVEDLVPNRVRARLSQVEPYSIFVFLLLVFVPPLRKVTLDPLFGQIGNIRGFMEEVLKTVF